MHWWSSEPTLFQVPVGPDRKESSYLTLIVPLYHPAATAFTEKEGLAEIGWRLHPFAWGRGLATEGALAILRHGFETVGLERIVAETMVVNARSRSVMRKLGMRHTAVEVRAWEDPLPGAEHGEWLAEITREEWLARPADGREDRCGPDDSEFPRRGRRRARMPTGLRALRL